jgi:CheY-like chemotaxis protein
MDTLTNAKNVVAFVVRDTGIGIPEDKQKLIFEAFQQADGTTSRKYGGTGLGLTISREIARLLGGIIEVDSTPGEGSTFTLFLPQNYMGQEGTSSEPVREEVVIPELPKDADFKGKKILVVDDDMRNIFAITSVLENQGMIVNYAENGKVAIKALKDNPNVDLVLMDTMMPEMDGLEAMKAIRGMPEFVDLPIISLTAKAMKGDREHCISAGASDYITKPVDPTHLLGMMNLWLNSKKQKELQLQVDA